MICNFHENENKKLKIIKITFMDIFVLKKFMAFQKVKEEINKPSTFLT